MTTAKKPRLPRNAAASTPRSRGSKVSAAAANDDKATQAAAQAVSELPVSTAAQEEAAQLEGPTVIPPGIAASSLRATAPKGRIPIIDVLPAVDCGRRAAKAIVGERFAVSATIFGEGHDAIAANVVLRGPGGQVGPWTPMRALAPGDSHVDAAHGGATDRWVADVTPTAPGDWTYTIEAWKDVYFTWTHAAMIKIPAGVDVELMLEEGAQLLTRAAEDSERDSVGVATLRDAVTALRDTDRPVEVRLAAAISESVRDVLRERPLRDLVCEGNPMPLHVERERAGYGSWYELFPRSEGAYQDEQGNWHSGTFTTAAQRLPAVAAMGFDVVYLPPIHPIGEVNRKGPNNTLTPGPNDPGSPWAIGSAYGGHDAVHPDLGTLADFDAFVGKAKELGMEVALDLALQCAPDHPWVKEHEEWFTVLADGSIAYAENPPKKYQDIYPLNFDNDFAGLYGEIVRVVRHWMDHGVRIFRVDNPHTKPVSFWEKLISDIRSTDPDVIFLAEAFTKPPMMHMLAKAGFQQSYSYFTWRTSKSEITEYLLEVSGDASAYMRPNFFVNTPDILPAHLQFGGEAMFKIRAALAATSSPAWGVYAGYELYEHLAVRPDSEEYLDSEKYQYRPRDWASAEAEGRSLAPYLTRLNEIRRAHPALQRMRNITFHAADDDAMLVYSKHEPANEQLGTGADTVLMVLNLDSHSARSSWIHLNMPALGYGWDDQIPVTDSITGTSYLWGRDAWVRLDPWQEPVHIFTLPSASSG